jgi:hypothetical protein
VKALAEWRNRKKESTKHFDFESTVPPAIYASYRDRMEAYFTEFSKMWGIKQPKDGRLLVCFYGDEETFHQVSAPATASSATSASSSRSSSTSTTTASTRARGGRDVPRVEPLPPEAAEPVQRHAPLPGESLAEYYGASSWDDKAKKLTVGLIQDERLAEVKTDIDGGEMLGARERWSGGRRLDVRALHVGLVARALPDGPGEVREEVPEVRHHARHRHRRQARDPRQRPT